MIVEKGAEPAATHYDIGAIHSRWQKEQDLDFDESRWINEHARYASFKNDQSVLRTWIENSGATVEWIADTYTKHFGQESRSSSTPRTITPAAPPTSSRPSAIMCPTPAS